MTQASDLPRNRQGRLAGYPEGRVREENFTLAEDMPVREPGPGEAVPAVRYVSIDPAMRIYMDPGSIIATICGCSRGRRAGRRSAITIWPATSRATTARPRGWRSGWPRARSPAASR